GDAPPSFAQTRLWFLDRLEPGSAGYNIPGGLRMRGQLDVAVLERCLMEVVRRHEALRTTFEDREGDAFGRIHAEARIALALEDLRSLAPTARDARVKQRMREEAEVPFDLARGPLLRARALRLADDEHVLLFTMHHIVSDGWSLGVLVREVGALYASF